MPQRAPLGFKRKICFIILLLALIMTLTPVVGVSAVNEWQEDDDILKTSIISKPVDPVFINVPGAVDVYGQPEYRENISIPVPLGESWSLI